jgi:RimJ/RimL family protein N-acetyltransferase
VTLLAWRTAQRGDRPLLQAFTCTGPACYDRWRKQKVHPREWELEVQTGIRDINPSTEGQFLYLGIDDQESIGAVCLFAPLDQPDQFKLMGVAVAMRYRRQGGAYADEAITQALQAAADQAAQHGRPHAYVTGFVHERNLASQRMCQRHGFMRVGPAPGLASYEEWSIIVATDAAPASYSPAPSPS